ncbi:sensor histidine kinase [Magnetospirillum sp. UT-4]|uniref:sensor histidine kinase n=1 Tax=Magnetospirillum sp. UT-4 TaxID=2681467 RepID=UPI0015730C37|nr:sensor histidine kinase [Magnetospirillum sp. UT-4]
MQGDRDNGAVEAPAQKRPWHARRSAAALVLVLALAQGGESWLAYRNSIEETEAQLAERTLSSARQVEASLRSVESVLHDTAVTFGPGRPAVGNAVVERFRGRIRAMPELVDLIVVGSDGRIVAPNLTDGPAPGTDVGDRDYFRIQRDAFPREALHIGTPVISRVVGRPLLPASLPFADPLGGFGGVVAAGTNPEHFDQIMESITHATGASAALMRLDGTVLSRYPDPREHRGKRSVVDLPGVLRPGQLTFLRLDEGFDGAARFVGLRLVGSYPLVVSSTVLVHDALAEWRSRTWMAASIFGLLAAVVSMLAHIADRREMARMGLLGRLIAHRIRLEEEVADRTRHLEAARAEAQRHGKRLDLVLKGANDGWWDWDLGTDEVYCSPRFWSMLGFSPEAREANAAILKEYIHPDDVVRVEGAINQALTGAQQGFETEYRLRHRDGHYLPVLSRAYVLRDEFGRAVRVSGSNMDLTERRHAEEAVHSSEEKLRALFDMAPVGIARNTMDGRFQEANGAFLRIVGYDIERLNTLSYWDLTPASYADEEARQLASLNSVGAYGPYEKEYIHSSGRRVPVRLQGVLIEDSNGERYIWSIVEDVSERRAAEQALVEKSQELARSNDDLEQFAYVASHDLREPLRMVNSYVSLLERRYADKLDAEGREFIAFARDGAIRLDRLVLDLLDYSRVKRQGGDLVPVAADEAMTSALDTLHEVASGVGAEVVVEGPLPQVMAAPIQLQRLFQNLIGNALKYRAADRPPRITVTVAREPDGMWRFTVADNGIGIEPHYFERIFGIFQRLHTRDQYEGTGIGLALCRSIVEHHGGRLWVESEPGAGSRFHFTLKGADAAA